MVGPVEQSVQQFYDTYGWHGGEEQHFRQFRPAYRKYHAGAVERTQQCFEDLGGRLLIVGGGDIPDSHVEVSAQFDETTCVDISEVALEIARRRLPGAQTLLGSVCALDLPSGSFNAVFAAHVIYHIDAELQARAVREMLRVTRPGGRVVILYSNPGSPIRFAAGALQRLRKAATPSRAVASPGLYFRPHPLKWWRQFSDAARVSLRPWDIIGSFEERTLIGSDRAAEMLYAWASRLERRRPGLAVSLWQYSIVVLDRV